MCPELFYSLLSFFLLLEHHPGGFEPQHVLVQGSCWDVCAREGSPAPWAGGTRMHLLSCLCIYTTRSQNAPQPAISPTLEAAVPSRAVIASANLTHAQHP